MVESLFEITKKCMIRSSDTFSIFANKVNQLPQSLAEHYIIHDYYHVRNIVKPKDAFATLQQEEINVFNVLNGYALHHVRERCAIYNTPRNNAWYREHYMFKRGNVDSENMHVVTTYVSAQLTMKTEFDCRWVCYKCAKIIIPENLWQYAIVSLIHEKVHCPPSIERFEIHDILTHTFNWCAHCRVQPLVQFMTSNECLSRYHTLPLIWEEGLYTWSKTKIPISVFEENQCIGPRIIPYVTTYDEFRKQKLDREHRHYRRNGIRI